MGKNTGILVKYLAFNQAHEEIYPLNTTIEDVANHLRCICPTFVITDMQPTSRTKVKIKHEEDGD